MIAFRQRTVAHTPGERLILWSSQQRPQICLGIALAWRDEQLCLGEELTQRRIPIGIVM